MKNAFYAIVFVLALAAAYAVSQTEAPAKPPETSTPAAGQQATQPATDSTTSKTQDEPQNQTPAAPDSHSHPDASAAATSDSGIQKQIEQQLASQNLNGVAVAVNNGIVTLTGSVPAKEDRKRAKELAKAVPGVRKVDEKLEIKSPSASAASGGHLEQASAQAPSTAGSIAGNTTAASGTQAPSSTQSTTTTTSPAGAASSTSSTQNTQSSVSGAAGSSINPAPVPQSTLPAGGVTGAATSTTTQSSGAATTGGTSGGVTGAATTTTPQAGGTTTSGTQSSVGAGTNPPTSTATTTGTVATSAEGTDLQPQIQRALQSEPTLSSSSVTVTVTGDTIELSGSVPTGKEKQTAKRIAQSFAGNRKVVDRITVTGRGVQNAAPPAGNNAAPPQTPR